MLYGHGLTREAVIGTYVYRLLYVSAIMGSYKLECIWCTKFQKTSRGGRYLDLVCLVTAHLLTELSDLL